MAKKSRLNREVESLTVINHQLYDIIEQQRLTINNLEAETKETRMRILRTLRQINHQLADHMMASCETDQGWE